MSVPQALDRPEQTHGQSIHLTSITIKSTSVAHPDLPEDARLSVELAIRGNTISETVPITKDSATSSWILEGGIEVPENISSLTLIVTHYITGQDRKQLGSVELMGRDLSSVQQSGSNFTQTLLKVDNNSPALELTAAISIVPRHSPLSTPAVPESWLKYPPRDQSGARLTTKDVVSRLTRIGIIAEYGEVLLIQNDNPSKAHRLKILGDLFLERHRCFNNPVDLDLAIAAHNETVRLTPKDHAERSARLTNLGNSLARRFELSSVPADINQAIVHHDNAIRLIPHDHSDRPIRLTNLGNSYLLRFQRLGDGADINQAIFLQAEAVESMPKTHPEKPRILYNLGNSFAHRSRHADNIEDNNKSISNYESAVQLMSDAHPNKPRTLNNLANSFCLRYERYKDISDLDKAVLSQRDAVRLTPANHAGRPGRLNTLGNSLMMRFKHLGSIVDLDEANTLHRDSVALTPDGNPNKQGYLYSLGNSLCARFTMFGQISDLDEAISNYTAVVQFAPDSSQEQPGYLNSLGNSFRDRFERLGDLGDLDKAISIHEDSVKLTPDGHRDKPSRLSDLGNSFLIRFQHISNPTDIEKSISNLGDAVRLTPISHSNKPYYLDKLGISFMARFERLGDIADINSAISSHEDAVQLIPDDQPHKAASLSNLGNSFRTRFEHLGDISDMDRAISIHEYAVQLSPDGHPNKSAYLNNLGDSFRTRFEQRKDPADLEKAIAMQERAVLVTPDGQPDKLPRLINLGKSFQARFEHFGDQAALPAALSQFSAAAMSPGGRPSVRFDAALLWARLAFQTTAPEALEGYGVALDLLPRIAWAGQSIANRHKELTNRSNIPSEAAAVAIASGQYEKALEWLEHGRSIVWAQTLALRTPLDHLRAVDPSLAAHLTQVSRHLEHVSAVPGHEPSMEQFAQDHRRLTLEWEGLVETVRAIPGFEQFMRPKTMKHLASAARFGPVVVINVHKLRCDALVLMANLGDILHVPLDGCSHARAEAMLRVLNKSSAFGGRAMLRVGSHRSREDEQLQNILSELWSHVVKPILDALAIPVSRTVDPPRIWWCPTGPLALLPIHAAGLYGMTEPGSKISDYVTSSYTPTVAMLLDILPKNKIPEEFQLLLVAPEAPPGFSPLPNAKAEIDRILRRTHNLRVMNLTGVEATVERVFKYMKECSWVHFACHGGQDAADPMNSALILQDGRLNLSKIVELSLPHADFAFLSASETAKGDENLPEEAVHLAAGMLLAGYRSVIATTWSFMDNDGPLLADEVYSRLLKDGQPDSTQAAYALHHAVQRLRERSGSSFMSWVPFIHIGM